ncbi:MAG: M28 family peptidase [Lentisphaeria bacterium]|nr:M28 family peptidase [Lentisphaeria bacterium]
MDNKYLDTLFTLLKCHATPGDEDEVASFLLENWRQYGWKTRSLGRYAVIAERQPDDNSADAKTILLCAHTDSPGFIIQSVNDDVSAIAVNIGYPHFEEEMTKGVIKRADGSKYEAIIYNKNENNEWIVNAQYAPMRGERICYASEPSIHDGLIHSPFLDNRVGCAALCEIARTVKTSNLRIILAATTQEEFTGFGAAVLAAYCKPDLIICLDATYTDETQNVMFGKGPVLTITDKSVLLGMKVVQSIKEHCDQWNVPLQTEIYNFSGTDSKAFPSQGIAAPVLPILIPSEGNHTPMEKAAVADIDSLQTLLFKLCTDTAAVESLLKDIASFD